jgi:hypothetical protein
MVIICIHKTILLYDTIHWNLLFPPWIKKDMNISQEICPIS